MVSSPPLEQRAVRLEPQHGASHRLVVHELQLVVAGDDLGVARVPLERYARDAEVVTRHNQLQFVNYEAVGRTVLGLESNSPLF